MLDQPHMTSLFENATEGIILTNGAGNIVMANPAIERMFEYKREESGRQYRQWPQDRLLSGPARQPQEVCRLQPSLEL